MGVDRRHFLEGLGGFAVFSPLTVCAASKQTVCHVSSASRATCGLRVRFLGTGAADWEGADLGLDFRRLTSVLFDGHVLVDYTTSARDMLPTGCRPEVIFYTHSHADHYNAEAAVDLGVERVYCHVSWSDDLAREIAAAAGKLGRAAPRVIPMSFGQKAEESGVVLTSLPANHATERPGEHCSMYLVEKNETRLLYATDTAGIPVEAARIVGIDAQQYPGNPLTALIMEATMGVGYEDNLRIFTHSSVATVAQIVRVLKATNRYRPRNPEQKVYLTHLARTLHGAHEQVAAAVPAPLTPAFDGLDVVL